MKFPLFLLFAILLSFSAYSQVGLIDRYVDSEKIEPAWKLKISPSNWRDIYSGFNTSIQLEYFTGKYGICLENNFYHNSSRNRFYTMKGYRLGLELRKYKKYSVTPDNFGRYISLEFLYKDQEYSTFAKVENSRLDSTYTKNLNFDKKVLIVHAKLGVQKKINRIFEYEAAIGLGIRYREMMIDGLENYDDEIGTWTKGRYGSSSIADKKGFGLFPSISVNARLGIDINGIIAVRGKNPAEAKG